MNQIYEAWIVHDDSGETYGSYDYRNGSFEAAIYVAASLSESEPRIYSVVQVKGSKERD